MSAQHIQVDAAIVGAGAAGLSLLAHLGWSGWRGTVAVIDSGHLPADQRGWAWWSTGDGPFDRYAATALTRAKVAGADWQRVLALEPYAYRTLAGDALVRAATAPGRSVHAVTWVSGVAVSITPQGSRTEVRVSADDGVHLIVSATRVFDGVGIGAPAHARVPHLDFLGWRVQADADVFEPDVLTLMDFRTPQSDGVSFVYVLPESSRAALVERTTFVTRGRQPEHAAHLLDYLEQTLPPCGRTETIVERGTIPLAVPPGVPTAGRTLLGTPGGAVKASSGYAFARIQRHSASLAASMVGGPTPVAGPASRRWAASLDRLLLMLMREDPEGGRRVLEALLRAAEPTQLLRFLDEQLSVTEQMRLAVRLPWWLFPRAMVRSSVGASRRA